jgi:hypothetical protein
MLYGIGHPRAKRHCPKTICWLQSKERNSVLAEEQLARTVRAMRPMVPAKDFETSRRFYLDLGFCPTSLSERLIEMSLGPYSFILQNYYVEQWADNFVMHMLVSDLDLWWNRICALDLPSRYGVKSPRAPQRESWGVVAGLVDPSGVLWRITEAEALN